KPVTFITGLVLLSLACLFWNVPGAPHHHHHQFPCPLSHCPVFAVSISGNHVVLTCPVEADAGDIHWGKDEKSLPDTDKELDLENFSEMEHSGYYSCYVGTKNKENQHILYLKARVCEACMEVDLTTVASIVVADVCVTLGLLLLVYYWSKNRKAKCKPVMRGAGAGGRPRGEPQPLSIPPQPIRKGQRDLYSGLNQRGI
uniref:Ig-like domain-containing protein n=1 Tax=Oryctolagus cuniculus TaxID=9986 RepID=A0A5F9CBC3_RABIT